MLHILRELFHGQNQFASGGLLLMAIGGLGVWLRSIPELLWEWLVRQTTMMITVKDDDAAFVWVKEWFLTQPFLKRVRWLDLDTTLRGEEIALIPAPGRHWFWNSGRPFQVWFYRSEDTKTRAARRVESLTFRTIGRDRMVIKRFVDDIVACHRRRAALASYLYLYDDGWMRVQAYSPRSLASVILRPGEKEHLVQDVTAFMQSRHRYRVLGVPYHRGYLLYGPPGTGKTSLVSGLAAEFGMSIYALNLTKFNDRTLKCAINYVPERSIILFEDIDCMGTGTARPQSGSWTTDQPPATRNDRGNVPDVLRVTLSGLLNVLDGFSAPENVLFVMTTNRLETLDEALLRPGRIDYKLFLGAAAEAQKIQLFRKFFPQSSVAEAREFVRSHSAAGTMAEFQGLLLSWKVDKEEAEQVTAYSSDGVLV